MNLLIVGDRPPVQADLFKLCLDAADLRLVGEARSGSEAMRAAEVLHPDLMLLDMELPDMTGFDLLRALHRRLQRRTILVTDNSRDSESALAAGALDCLVKPIRADAFFSSILRARDDLEAQPGSLRCTRLVLERAEGRSTPPVFLVGERQRCLYPLDPRQIDYIESAGNYVTYRVGKIDYIARESIKRLDEKLRPLGFIRIERSLLLNIRAIEFAQPLGHGTFSFTLVCGATLHSGYGYREGILQSLPLRRHGVKRAEQRDPAEVKQREEGT